MNLLSIVRNSLSRRKYIGLLAACILLIVIPLTVYLSQQEQDIRQRASGCTDIVLAQAGTGGSANGNQPGTNGVNINTSGYCETKTLLLSWSPTQNATYYRLLIDNVVVYNGPALSFTVNNIVEGPRHTITLYAGNTTTGDFNPSTGAFFQVIQPTVTPTFTPSPVPPTATPTHTPTSSPTPLPTNTPTATPIPPTVTPIPPTATLIPTSTLIPTATPTSIPQMTSLHLSLLLHGIGAAGDNVLPQPPQCKRTNGTLADPENCLSNQNPLHPERTITVEVLNKDNLPELNVTGKIIYDAASGMFRGSIELGTEWQTGVYNIKVTTPSYLRRQIPGFHTITAGEIYNSPPVHLVSSDVDGDNKLTILDYNMIIHCYTFPGTESQCNSTEAIQVDVNDDGQNNEFDENIFRRDLIVQNGE